MKAKFSDTQIFKIIINIQPNSEKQNTIWATEMLLFTLL